MVTPVGTPQQRNKRAPTKASDCAVVSVRFGEHSHRPIRIRRCDAVESQPRYGGSRRW